MQESVYVSRNEAQKNKQTEQDKGPSDKTSRTTRRQATPTTRTHSLYTAPIVTCDAIFIAASLPVDSYVASRDFVNKYDGSSFASSLGRALVKAERRPRGVSSYRLTTPYLIVNYVLPSASSEGETSAVYVRCLSALIIDANADKVWRPCVSCTHLLFHVKWTIPGQLLHTPFCPLLSFFTSSPRPNKGLL